MTLNTSMPLALKKFYQFEIDLYRSARTNNQINTAWTHLERAHVIGQKYPWQHTDSHWKMLLLGIRTFNLKEIWGQVIRVILGGPFSFINHVPTGNVGRATVPLTEHQEIPKDIREMFNSNR